MGYVLNNVPYSYVIKEGNLISLRKGNLQPIDFAIVRLTNGFFPWYWAKGFELYGTHVVIKLLGEKPHVFYTVDIYEIAKSCLIPKDDAKLIMQKAQVTREQWEKEQGYEMNLSRVTDGEDEILEIVNDERFEELCQLKEFAKEQLRCLELLKNEIEVLKAKGNGCSWKKLQYASQSVELGDTVNIIESKKLRIEFNGTNSEKEQELFKEIDALFIMTDKARSLI